MHGKFQFQLQKYQVQGQGRSYFDLSNQLEEGYISPRLQELCAYYSNRLSYKEVEKLVERVTGEQLLSDQKIWQIVNNKALEISRDIKKKVASIPAQPISEVVRVNSKVDIYDSEEKEILLFNDGIQVKTQKAERQPKAEPVTGKRGQGTLKSKTPAIITDIVLLQLATGKFEYITAPMNVVGDDELRLTNMVKAKVIQEYSNKTSPLNIVAITDGAKVIGCAGRKCGTARLNKV